MKKLLFLSLCLLVACSGNPEKDADDDLSFEEELQLELEQENADPWEGFNRKVFAFNDFFDQYFLKYVAKGYDFITPDIVDDGITNIFSNLQEINTALNSLLQGKVDNAGNATGRFLVNSTVGLLGFFDVASKMQVEVEDEDFGQTLAKWGVASGPYIVIPFLGPGTVRDGLTRFADAEVSPISNIDHVSTRNTVRGIQLLDLRSDLLDAEELITGDKYIFLRDLYLQNREFKINDGEVEDDFGDEDF